MQDCNFKEIRGNSDCFVIGMKTIQTCRICVEWHKYHKLGAIKDTLEGIVDSIEKREESTKGA